MLRAAGFKYGITTGESHSLEAFVGLAFRLSGLNWRDHVEQIEALYRPSDIPISRVAPAKAQRVLGWRAKFHMREVVQALVEAEFVRAGAKRNFASSTEQFRAAIGLRSPCSSSTEVSQERRSRPPLFPATVMPCQ